MVIFNLRGRSNAPDSKDPDFWDVWIGEKDRSVDWKSIVKDCQAG
jgi:hypothetical protein